MARRSGVADTGRRRGCAQPTKYWNKFGPLVIDTCSPGMEHPMRIYSLAVTAVALIAFPFVAAAANQPTDMSSQVRVETGPGGVAVGVGRGRGRGRGCRTVTTR